MPLKDVKTTALNRLGCFPLAGDSVVKRPYGFDMGMLLTVVLAEPCEICAVWLNSIISAWYAIRERRTV